MIWSCITKQKAGIIIIRNIIKFNSIFLVYKSCLLLTFFAFNFILYFILCCLFLFFCIYTNLKSLYLLHTFLQNLKKGFNSSNRTINRSFNSSVSTINRSFNSFLSTIKSCIKAGLTSTAPIKPVVPRAVEMYFQNCNMVNLIIIIIYEHYAG